MSIRAIISSVSLQFPLFPVSWLSALQNNSQTGDGGERGKEKLAVVFGLKEADSAEPIICVAFHLPPVLCYRRTLDRWEMIPAGRETQQDVERREGCWQGERIRTQTHESTACKPYMHFDTFPLSIVLCYAFRTIWFTWLIAACEPGYWTQMLTRVQRQRSVVEVYYTQTHSLVVCWAGRGHVEAVQVQYRQKHWLPTKFSIDFVTFSTLLHTRYWMIILLGPTLVPCCHIKVPHPSDRLTLSFTAPHWSPTKTRARVPTL